MKKFILINGKKRSGKDFFARLLQSEFQKLGKTSEVMSFADPIKDIIAMTLGISHDDLDNLKNNEENLLANINGQQRIISNFRLILQNFGTEAMKKHFGENVWPNLLLEKANNTDADFIIVPDFRFLCENVTGGITVKIRNGDVQNSNDNHRSENELNDYVFDYELDNTGYSLTSKDANDFIEKVMMI